MIHTDAGYYTPYPAPSGGTGASYRHIWYLKDHLGNNRALVDGNGAPVALHDYDPFGEEIATASSSQLSPIPPGAKDSPYKYGGKEWSATTSTYDFEARQFSPSFHRFTTMDPLAEKYYSISPYAYCAGNPVNLVDPSGRIIVFVNGFTQRWTGAPGKGGEAYWHPGGSFVRTAQSIFNDSKTFFPDIRYSFTSSANQRRKDGYEYAKQNVSRLVGDLKKGESIRFVSHSMGAAFAEGMADYLIENGFPVDALIHFEPYQAAQIKSNGGRDDILSIDFQDIEDWVIQYISPGEMPDADHSIRVNYGATWDRIHTISIAGKMSWDEIQSLIDDFLNNDKD